ncbi:uncharacterized protein EV420DRAFT_1550432 [Desarmillaria tabescens]|uniref:Uncharacterized protein n=1 Tax=Armillaria tabescens TaxID=1929756 RepID=A0AA39KA21_ARMTA|nr:uncharacterized protein EV420DRAFT_1550432 [Desarmillaria tabescens]KAK0457356.1 hypothetical protein EV420DRAFT_1550432 [Desarmillaria tabescens]
MHVISPISHAWVSYEERMDFRMPKVSISADPQLIPKDTSPGLIRIEMLNLGAEYVWRDALYLKQSGGIREDLRIEEWKVVVPTTGSIYRRPSLSCLPSYERWEGAEEQR